MASAADVKPFNEVTFHKSEGSIRGPATRTQTLAPVSLYGNSNWGNVALPSTFFPDPDPVEMVVDPATVSHM